VISGISTVVLVASLITTGCGLHTHPGVPSPDGSFISEQSVRSHMEFLAGDALNGRGSGTRDEWIAASYVAAHMRRLGLEPSGDDGGYVQQVPLKRKESISQPVRTYTWNAVGRLPGRSGKRIILLSAHIDHLGSRGDKPNAANDQIFNGADDDASGAVAVLALMEALARGPRLRQTIVFALFGSEETGGNGSRYFAEKPVVPLTDIAANLQFEMIGRPDAKLPPRTLWLTGYERSTLGPALARHGAKLVQDPHPEQKFFERSDNIEFARRGVVAHTVSSYGLHTDYHTPDDEIDRIDFQHMTTAIRSMLEPIRWLANSDFVPQWLPGKKP
jgi:peptidase M28-like protein